MGILDSLPPASFDGIAFPFTSRNAKLVARHHVHEFNRMNGGAVEKLGRKVYEFSFEALFHEGNPRYPGLYPDSLRQLRERAERLDTASLVIPEIGTIRAMISELSQTRRGKSSSGEEVSIHFIEDDLEPFRKATLPASRDSFAEASAAYIAKVKEVKDTTEYKIEIEKEKPKKSFFDSLDDAIGAINAISDQAELLGNQFASKLDKVAALCKAIHNTVSFLKNPVFHALAESIRGLWDATRKLKEDLHKSGRKLVPYVVPAVLSVGTIAGNLYGDASRGGEILSLNAIPDPYAIPAGTRLQVYQAGT